MEELAQRVQYFVDHLNEHGFTATWTITTDEGGTAGGSMRVSITAEKPEVP